MKRNKELDASAQKWAEHLASTGKLENSNVKYKGDDVGENISSKRGTGTVDYTGSLVCVLDSYHGDVLYTVAIGDV